MNQKYFEDFVVGERFSSPSRTLTDAHFLFFAGLTGDDHPIHYDDEYAATHAFGKRVTHGLLLASITALGGSDISPQLEQTVLAFVEQRTRFLQPVLIGDTVQPHFEVTECEAKSRGRGLVRMRVTVCDRLGRELVEGEHVYLIKSRDRSAEA